MEVCGEVLNNYGGVWGGPEYGGVWGGPRFQLLQLYYTHLPFVNIS